MNDREPTISQAILALGIKGGWKLRDGKVVKWYSEQQQPSDKEIQDKYEALKLEWTANEYSRNRAEAYDSVGNQLDQLMKDMRDGTTTHQAACEAVKAKFPKPA